MPFAFLVAIQSAGSNNNSVWSRPYVMEGITRHESQGVTGRGLEHPRLVRANDVSECYTVGVLYPRDCYLNHVARFNFTQTPKKRISMGH